MYSRQWSGKPVSRYSYLRLLGWMETTYLRVHAREVEQRHLCLGDNAPCRSYAVLFSKFASGISTCGE